MSAPLVPDSIVRGEKFVKWDEDSGVGTPVTLHIDENGFFLYWIDQNKEMDLLDISTIRDSRTGKQAKIPKDLKLRQIVSMGCAQDTLEEKTVTICSGPDFVNLTFINFCCTKKEIAQLWTDHILKLAYSLTQLNSSVTTFLRKAHTKLTLNVDKAGKIPVKNVVKMFAQNKEDRKRVKSALEATGFPSGKEEMVSAQKFSFEEFFNFFKNLTQRSEVEKIFEDICGSSKRKLMTASQLMEFLNKTQRDPRLNEILHPYTDLTKAKDLIAQYELNKNNIAKCLLSFDGFLRYLMSSDNSVVSTNKLELSDDMDHPLSHYFINSSHNTYLSGHQLTGKSSVEMYRQCLLAGCRCVELDFWNGGRAEEPVIVHGYTFVPEIPAKDVIEAIAESAFKTSDFPVILSFENHCNPRQQAKIAQYCRDIFGDMLLDQPLEGYQLEPGAPLPPPSLLKRKIIIKNKKKHHHSSATSTTITTSATATLVSSTTSPPVIATNKSDNGSGVGGGDETVAPQGSAELPRQSSKEGDDTEEIIGPGNQIPDEDIESSSEDEDDEEDDEGVGEKPAADKTDKPAGGPAKESEAGAEISALVNYVQPVHFSSFEVSEKKNRCYEMSSFDERQATMLLKETPIEFVKYNKRQLSRIYPVGTRFDSSNFMPQVFWNAGCQLVALNYQTLDLAMQLNLGIYEYNHRCGYLLKPEFMRRPDRRFDPFAESTVDGIIAGSVTIHVISGQFLTDKRCGTYVEVDMYGLPADTVRKKFRTRIVPNNAINPIFDEEPFVFKKVVLPDLACIRIAAYEEGGKLIGHRVLPVVGLCPGYRHVSLRSECGQPLGLPTLFVLIVVKDYVPDGLSDFAEALANPIKYQSELEKRAKQLAVLTDEDIDEAAQIANDEMLVTAALMGAGKCKRAVAPPQLQTQISGGSGGSSTGVQSGGGGGTSLLVLHHLALAPPNPTGTVLEQSPPPPSPSMLPQPIPVTPKIASLPPSAFDPATLAGVIVNEVPPPKSPPVTTTAAPATSIVATVTSSTMPNSLSDEITAEPFESFIESKPVKEKKLELEKKLEALRKKQDKERTRIQSVQDTDKSKTKFYISNKLVKRLSSKNMEVATTAPVGGAESVVEASGVGAGAVDSQRSKDGTGDSEKGKVGAGDIDKSSDKTRVGGKTPLPRSLSERMLAVCKDHINQERELQDKYHEMVFAMAHKTMVTSQSQQLKLLRTLLDREMNQVMRRLQADRRQEVKALAKQHRDRDELVRMKREVASAMVEKGVHECVRLKELYEKKREELEKQHTEVRSKLAAEKTKVKAALDQEFEVKCTKVEQDIVEEANR